MSAGARSPARVARALLVLSPLAVLPACVTEPVEEARPVVARRPITPHEAIVEGIALQRAVHQPDDHHLRLDGFVGQWHVLVHACPPARSEPVLVARGTAKIDWMLGRRYLEWDIRLDVGETTNVVSGHMGYDVVADEYQALWISDITTGMSIVYGNGNPQGRGLVMVGTGTRGGRTVVVARSVLRFVGQDSFVIERYGAQSEVVIQRSTYVRRSDR